MRACPSASSTSGRTRSGSTSPATGAELHREKAMLRLGEAIERTGAIPTGQARRDGRSVVAKLVRRRARARRRAGSRCSSRARAARPRTATSSSRASLPQRVHRCGCSRPRRRAGSRSSARSSATRVGSQRLIAVCDVGGGSAQVAVGTRREGVAWVRSIDIGSMRLTSRCSTTTRRATPPLRAPGTRSSGCSRGSCRPLPETALAVGGSARALRSIVGSELGADELDEVAGILARTPAREIVELYGIEPDRVRTLAAGAVILGAIRERLHVPLPGRARAASARAPRSSSPNSSKLPS